MQYALCQINPIVGNFKHNLELIKKYSELAARKKVNLAIFPELCLSGYLAEDLFLNTGFLEKCYLCLKELIKWSASIECAILIGLPLQKDGKVYNSAVLIHKGTLLSTTYKNNLPNYGVFDEQRVFTAYDKQQTIKFKNTNINILICEDMWVENVKANGDIFIVINSSPFDTSKKKKRLEIASKLVKKNKLPLIYVNQVGGQDDLVFDGGSFAIDQSGKVAISPQQWTEGIYYVNFAEPKSTRNQNLLQKSSTEVQDIYQALVLSTRDYIYKNNFKKVLLGASGGIDSALVGVIAADAIGAQNVRLVRLPSQYSSSHSLEDAEALAKNLKANLTTLPINTPFDCMLDVLKKEFKGKKPDVTEENIQARVRGVLLMALSNKYNELLLTTGNKSEYACGYATLYGDMCGGFAPLKDVYKTTVYKLANWRNANIPLTSKLEKLNVIPKRSIKKPPSAELRPEQLDQDTLPPYELLDKILYEFIENDFSPAEVISKGFDKEIVTYVAKLLRLNEYKRKQSALGVKVSTKTLGRERRYPATNHF